MSNRYGYVNNGLANVSAQSSAANGVTSSTISNPYLQQLQQRLQEAQDMQKQLQSMGSNPYAVLNNMISPPTQPAPAPQQVQPPVQEVSPEGQAVLALFEEFARTEDGKLLVSYMGKFNSYCQSMIAKSQS